MILLVFTPTMASLEGSYFSPGIEVGILWDLSTEHTDEIGLLDVE